MSDTKVVQDVKLSSPNLKYVLLISLVAALGGLLFGYDTAVIAGAIGFMQEHFNLTAAMKGWAGSSALVGCIIGATFAGVTSDKFGRRKTLIICAILFSLSAIGSALPRNLTEFSLARILGGLGIGAASMLSPLYIAEISPAKFRGRLVSLNQLAIVTGILVVYFVNLLIQRSGNHEWNVLTGWRWMFGSGVLPAGLFFIMLFFVPESPRWLAKQQRNEEALQIFTKVSGSQQANTEMKEVKETIAHEGGTIAQLFQPGLRTALIIGVVLAVFQQITGINAIMYYAPEIFKAAGGDVDTSFVQAVSVGLVNLILTFVAIWLVDRAGRKSLMLIGSALQTISLFAVGYFYHINSKGPGVLVFILLYVAAFAVSLGPVVWVIIAEIFPTRIRGRAMSIATLVLWAACYLVSQTFPMLVEGLGSAATFWTYGIMSILCFVFILSMVPETKGKTLEEIEQGWLK